ncbi:unnamed protein product [Rangifer tarandus platyrhynchus]|uniref:Uncharacterized protein n=1 Tax=Rangifer tarandus platyrhynchus TaxID=3082113 RepID=A0ABN9A2Z7_RANTA|nr:unnamed protein product [Rangifer tarandus platyrhynchus]
MGAAGAALPAARRDSPRYPEGQWRTAITIKRLALRSAKAVKPQRQPPLPPLATSSALSRSRVPSETQRSLAGARRPCKAAFGPRRFLGSFPPRRPRDPADTHHPEPFRGQHPGDWRDPEGSASPSLGAGREYVRPSRWKRWPVPKYLWAPTKSGSESSRDPTSSPLIPSSHLGAGRTLSRPPPGAT